MIAGERSPDLTRPLALALCGAAVVVGGGLRVAGGFTDFWLDEIWTWSIAQRLRDPLQVFTAIHHSNNNHLNTLLVYALGDASHWIAYRVPSLVAGTASIALAAAIAWRRGRLEAVFAATLFAACYAQLHFSSEARGYAPSVFFSLAALSALQRELERPGRLPAFAFGTFALLALLSHLIAVFFLIGAACQSAWHLWARRAGTGAVLAHGLRLYALPCLGLLWLWWVDLRFLVIGGGNPSDVPALAARTLGFGLGLPVERALALPYVALAGGIAGVAARLRVREGDASWVLPVVGIAAPLAAFSVLQPDVIAVRYFLIALALLLLLLADLLAHLARSHGARRAIALGLLALFVVGNAAHIAAFLERGRGGFRDALFSMAEATEGARIVVGSDHDFRNGEVLRFYARGLPEDKRLVYLERGHWPKRGPEWIVTHGAARPESLRREIRDGRGNRYALFAEFDHAAISGFYWALYRSASRNEASR